MSTTTDDPVLAAARAFYTNLPPSGCNSRGEVGPSVWIDRFAAFARQQRAAALREAAKEFPSVFPYITLNVHDWLHRRAEEEERRG